MKMNRIILLLTFVIFASALASAEWVPKFGPDYFLCSVNCQWSNNRYNEIGPGMQITLDGNINQFDSWTFRYYPSKARITGNADLFSGNSIAIRGDHYTKVWGNSTPATVVEMDLNFYLDPHNYINRIISGGYSHISNIEFWEEPGPTDPSGWVSFMDKTYWHVRTGMFDGNNYVGDSGITLIPSTGTWKQNFRPTKVRITFEGSETITSSITDDNGVHNVWSNSAYVSGTEEDIVWDGRDIWYFQIGNWMNNVNVTDIEFYFGGSSSNPPLDNETPPWFPPDICTMCPDCCIGPNPPAPTPIDVCITNPEHADCQDKPPTACTGSSCIIWPNPENITGDDGFNEDNIVLGDCFVAINSPAMDMKFNATAYLIWNNSDGHCGSNDIFMAQEFLPDADEIRAKNTKCTICNEIAMTNDFITSFKVTHFSSYAIGGNSRLDIYDEYESASAPVDTSIAFYANFTNITSDSHIPGATCMISFDSDPTEYAMTDNGNNYNYTLAGGFSSVGTHSFHVECAATGYTTLNTTDDIQVGEAGEIPEFGTVTLIIGLLIIAIAVIISRKKQ